MLQPKAPNASLYMQFLTVLNIVAQYRRTTTLHEVVLEALEVEEDMEIKEEAKRNLQEDYTKGLDESTL